MISSGGADGVGVGEEEENGAGDSVVVRVAVGTAGMVWWLQEMVESWVFGVSWANE